MVPPLRGASSFCVDIILAKRPAVPQRLRPKPSSLKGLLESSLKGLLELAPIIVRGIVYD